MANASKLQGIFLVLSLIVCGCATTQNEPSRTPTSASVSIAKELKNLFNEEIETQNLNYKIDSFISQRKKSPRGRPVTRISKGKDPNYQALEIALQDSKNNISTIQQDLSQQLQNTKPISAKTHSSLLFKSNNPYEKIEFLNLDIDTINHFNDSTGGGIYIMDSVGQDDYKLAISSELFSHESKLKVAANISCDSDFTLSTSRKKIISDGKKTSSFNLFDSGAKGAKHYFSPTSPDTTCNLELILPNSKKSINIQLITNIKMISAELMSEKESCLLPTNATMTNSEKLFYTDSFVNFSCPASRGQFDILDDPIDALNNKIFTLLGRKIPREILEKKNPYFPLDFSSAPKLDAIYISYLVFRHDFYGKTMLRLLEHHAKQGTEIKILNSRVIEHKKDHVALKNFALSYPNVKYEAFKYPGRWQRGISDKFNSLHRTNHVKAFITISKKNPENNMVILGGRNIHDGFLFKTAPDHASFPELVNYAAGEDGFVHWLDLEAQIKSPKIARDVARQMLSLWNSDYDTARFQPSTVQIPIEESNYLKLDSEQIHVRHIFSGPYRDDHALEKYYADMFESAKISIQIVSPYLRLTPKLADSLTAAIARGVKITINTRIDLTGDTIDVVLTDVNKKAVNKLKDKVDLYEWIEPGVILHTKLILIDDQLSFLGGINLNKRSFIHDFENGVLVSSKEVNSQFKKLIEKYTAGSRLVTAEQNTKWWTGIIIQMFDEVF